MPGYILHITAAQMLFNKATTDLAFINRDSFQFGNLIPDSVTDKTYSHFRHPSRQEKLMVYPDLDLFLNKYRQLLTDSSCMGYYFHLFIDRMYAKDYIPQIVSFHDKNGVEAFDRKEITHALIKRTKELVPIKTFFSDEYYYGDFTKLNTYLIQRFDLSTNLIFNVENPGITEVNYTDIDKIQNQLKEYVNIPIEATHSLRVFDIEHLLNHLDEMTSRFMQVSSSYRMFNQKRHAMNHNYMNH